jgi:type I restriction enzyme, S subunit
MSTAEGWENVKLGEIAEIKGGKRLPAGEQFSEEVTPFPYVRVTDMVNGTIDDSDLVYVKPTIEPLIRRYKISSQDLYVTIAGTLGQFGRIPEHLDGAQLTENA